MWKEGQCMQCMQEKPMFLHKIYYKSSVLQFCTSCLLRSYPGTFCPICFKVYENDDFSAFPAPVRCTMCPAVAHFNCILHTSASSSSSNPTSQNYVCPCCSNPKFRFFNCPRGERPQFASIDTHLGVQLVAASLISERSMREGAALCKERAERKAEQAAEAQKEAKKALDILAELTMPNLRLDDDDDDSMQISPAESHGEEEECSDEGNGDEEESIEEENSDEESG